MLGKLKKYDASDVGSHVLFPKPFNPELCAARVDHWAMGRITARNRPAQCQRKHSVGEFCATHAKIWSEQNPVIPTP